jgi:hypothetical protein
LAYVLDQGALVLKGVTLAEMVELVVEVLVDFAAGPVLDQETAEDSLAAHPEDLAVGLSELFHAHNPQLTKFPPSGEQRWMMKPT